MIELRTLGPLEVTADGGDGPSPVLAQPRRAALLCYLVLASPRGFHRRDTLFALFWPEHDTQRAQHALRQSVYFLRRALGPEAIVSRGGGELAVAQDQIRCDAWEFEAAIVEGRPADALALHRGEPLAGFHISSAPEFERWLDGERERVRRLAADAAWALSAERERDGDSAGSGEAGRYAAGLVPDDEAAIRRLMLLLERLGDRAGAVRAYEALAWRLEGEYELQPAAETQALVARIRASSSVPRAEPTPAAPVVPSPAGPAREPPRARAPTRSRLRQAAVLGVGLGLAVIAAGLAVSRTGPREPSIVVLPFASLAPGGERDHFTDGLTDEITHGLARVPGLTVIAHNSALRYRTSAVELPVVADELGVTHILHGTVRRDAGRARITARLVAAGGERVLWSAGYDSEIGDVLGVQERIAREVVRALALRLGDDTGGAIVRHGTDDAEALDYYRRGRFLWSRRRDPDVAAAIAYFERAIARDSSYADAWAGLADAYLVQQRQGYSNLPEAEARARVTRAAERALALDDRSADAHNSFAAALWWQGNWPGAEREFRRALDLNPNHVSALTWYSMLLAGLGRQDEALRAARRATELDPFALTITYAWQCYLSRDWECAIEQSRRSIEIDTAWTIPHVLMARSYAHLGRRPEAMQAMQRPLARFRNGTALAELAFIQASFGEYAAARASLARAKADSLVSQMHVARVHAALGERDSAFAALERQPTWMWPQRATIHDPDLDPVRGDSRMSAIAAKVEREMGVR